MNSIQQRTRSVWMAELPEAAPEMTTDLDVDVAIVGAGIGGLTTAYLLAREGKRVVVVDSGIPGGGMTARTSAHLACALDERWHALIARRGERDARLAAQAHKGAIDLIAQIASDAKIDCDIARIDGYLVPASDKDIPELEKELAAAHKVGLEDVTLESRTPFLSYSSTPCLRFPNQGRFHPVKYLRGLSANIESAGGMVRTGHVTGVEPGERVVLTLKGGRAIHASAAVIATSTPINDASAAHAKLTPYRSYVIAGHVPKGSVPDALLWDTASPYHYVRIQPAGERSVIIVGGEDHKTGAADDMIDRIHRLETWARERFPMIDRITWRWSGQIIESVDFLGYLGRSPDKARNVYVITGDSGLGITHATIGARIIADQIAERPNAWADLFDPARMKDILPTAGPKSDHPAAADVASVDEIPRGSGAIVRRGKQKIAAYRDGTGALTACSAVCPHMGCIVAWNAFEKCWDCPCHGSQFSVTGAVINGPATTDLEPVPPEEDACAIRPTNVPVYPSIPT